MSKLLIKTPLTDNGINLRIGADGKQEFNISVLGMSAKTIIEKENEKVHPSLRKQIEVIEDDDPRGWSVGDDGSPIPPIGYKKSAATKSAATTV